MQTVSFEIHRKITPVASGNLLSYAHRVREPIYYNF